MKMNLTKKILAAHLAKPSDMVPGAVSYTHLDVYKRQVVHMALVLIGPVRLLGAPKNPVALLVGQREDSRRRGVVLGDVPRHACLLYTSYERQLQFSRFSGRTLLQSLPASPPVAQQMKHRVHQEHRHGRCV